MPEIIKVHKGSELSPWIVQSRKQNPQTDRWEDDDLSDVTAVKVSMTNSETGVVVFAANDGYVYDVVNALLAYDPEDTDVDDTGWYELVFTLTRAGGKPHVLPSDDTNKVFVHIWE